MSDERRAIRTAMECMRDHMTGQWAELRDLARDEPAARMVIDGVLYRPRDAEAILLDAVLHLIRENAVYRANTLRILATLPSPPAFLLGGARTGESNAHD